TNVYPKRPDRAYIGYLDGGAIVLDISDKSRPKPVMRWDYHPPMSGFCHTVLPLFDRGLLVVTDEATKPHGEDYPKLVWIVDVHVENKPVSIATCPVPPTKPFFKRGGRFGAHNLHENKPVPGTWVSENIIVGTFFNGGVRAYDLSDPFFPREVAYAAPAAPGKVAPQAHPTQGVVGGGPRVVLGGRPHHRRFFRVRAEGLPSAKPQAGPGVRLLAPPRAPGAAARASLPTR